MKNYLAELISEFSANNYTSHDLTKLTEPGFDSSVSASGVGTQDFQGEKISGKVLPIVLTKPTEPKRFVLRFTEEWRQEAWDSWKPPWGFIEPTLNLNSKQSQESSLYSAERHCSRKGHKR